jgi:hypothetical protein
MCCIPAAGIAKCSQLTSSFQVRQHGLPFPMPIMVKNKPTGPLSSSWAGQDANQGQHSSFLPHLSVPLSSNTCVLYKATSAAHRKHDIQEGILLDTRVFKSSQTWTRALRVGRTTQIKLLASRQFTRPKSVHATTMENDRCKKGLNIYFKSKCTQTGSYLGRSSVENNNTADWTYSLKNSEQ